MRKNFGQKTWIYPMPVLIIATYNEDGTPNAMNAAWGGTYDYNKITISLGEHKTTENLARTKSFTVGFADVKNVAEADYVGLVSGSKVSDKVAKCGWTVTKSPNVDAPIIDQLPMTLECKVDSFDNGTLVGSILNISVDEKYLGEDGLPDVKKLGIITYDPIHHCYIALGDIVGKAFQEGNKIK